jgi:hypothetical protein
MTPEHERLEAARLQARPWTKWGPYLSERQWGTVREDYSEGGNAWDYLAESDTAMFGGNSNWRGPIWAPVNVLILRALLQYYTYHGNSFTVECPTGSGRHLTLYQVAEELARRLERPWIPVTSTS